MNFQSINQLNVFLNIASDYLLVGILAQKNQTIYFEYDLAFIQSGLEISPIKLPLKPGLQSGEKNLFEGLPGVFNDSLPDGWGRLLLDRAIRRKGFYATQLTALDRLSHVGKNGMGALCYEPAIDHQMQDSKMLSLDDLALQTQQILQGEPDTVITELLALNASSAGARPKAMIGLNKDKNHIIQGTGDLPETYEHWLVKFSNSSESIDSGAIEYTYSEMAKLAGIEMPETHLLPSKKTPGYFATKRFDRNKTGRLHIHSVCGLLSSDFRTPCLDYQDLLKLTFLLTKNKEEVLKLYRLAVFNVLACNKDDHSKNFSFIMNPKGQWNLAPAYDLTFSSGPGGEQSMLVLGEGHHISIEKLTTLGVRAGISLKNTKMIIDDVLNGINQWKPLAKNAGVSRHQIEWIYKTLETALRHC